MSNSDIILMLGMSQEAWNATISQELNQYSAEQFWRAKIALKLECILVRKREVASRKRVCDALRAIPEGDGKFVRAIMLMVKMIPSALNGAIGVKGHMLSSICGKYRQESNLLKQAIVSIKEEETTSGKRE